MAISSVNFALNKDSDSLSPIPDVHRQGLAAVAVLAGLSFVSSTAALLYLTIKLVRWHTKKRRERKSAQDDDLSDRPFDGEQLREHAPAKPRTRAHPNQFLVLILNLLLADIHQAAAFLLNAVWVGKNSIDVQSPTCFAQGWLISTGDLSSSCFITAIAVHTYLAVVWNYKPPQWTVYATVVGLWIFDYQLAVLGPAITRNGRDHGGFYVRAAAWCWVNISYETYRLVLHYLFIFISLAVTSILYTLIFFSLRRHPSPASTTTSLRSTDPTKSSPDSSSPPAGSHHHRAFLLYPVIYVVCTAPIALGRIVAMAGVSVPVTYFCVAGALITSNGWLDVLLWGLTRQNLLFNSEVDSEDTGLETFTFMRTPQGRKYGNIVWVEGAASGRETEEERRKRGKGWTRLHVGREKRERMTASQESLRDHGHGAASRAGEGIQMDLVTTVVVERDEEVGKSNRERGGSGDGFIEVEDGLGKYTG